MSLGPKSIANHRALVVTKSDPGVELIDNAADTPFDLDGRGFPSVTAFWRSLSAREIGETIRYRGQDVVVGTWGHWRLMRSACLAKFTQCPDAMDALLATGERPLICAESVQEHVIPSVVIADIWMTLRRQLRSDPALRSAPHRGNSIHGFRDGYRWLSNFWPATVSYENALYPSVEHAYQAAKTLDPDQRDAIRRAETPGEAKRMSTTIDMRPDWAQVRLVVMEDLLRQKFRDPELARRLVATADAVLVEGNTWGDTYWGVSGGEGENRLGRLLMRLRDDLRA